MFSDAQVHKRGRRPSTQELFEVLVPFRSDWKSMGIAFGIEYRVLKCIQAQHQDLKDRLYEVIEEWLDRSWEGLVKALRTKTVDNAELAGRVEEEYCRQIPLGADQCDSPLDPLPRAVPESNGHNQALMRTTHKIENPALSLVADDIVRAVKQPGSLAFKLYSQQLVSQAAFEDILACAERDQMAKLLPAVDSTIQNNPSKFEVLVDTFNASKEIPADVVNTLKGQGYHKKARYLDSAVCRNYADYLKLRYSRTPENKWPQSKINYIALNVVKKKQCSRQEAHQLVYATLHDGIDKILAARELVKMEDILKPLQGHSKVHCLYIEGPPGIGKSTYVWELCKRWDVIPDIKKFSLVVHLSLRDKRAQEAESIADLFFHDDASIQQAVAKEVCNSNGEGLLLILDGFDEIPSSLRKLSLFLDIIKGSRLPGCTVIVTSRPSATADLLETSQEDKYIEVLGFAQREIDEYANTVFACRPQLLEGFHQYRKLNPDIRSMMYIPLNTVIIADVFLSTGEPLSHTITQLYLEMSLVILKRYLKEIGRDDLADNLPTNLEDLPSDICSHFLRLGEMAFNGVVRQEVIFNELPTECEHFGFLNSTTERYVRSKPALSCSFLHRSFQELFTAFHISQLKGDVAQILEKYFKDDRFKEVWKFVAGLNCFKNIGWTAVESQSSVEKLVSYLYEAQDVQVCNSVLGEKDENFKASSLSDCHAVGWCIAASECRLSLCFRSIESSGEEVCKAFANGVNSLSEVRGSISELRLQRISKETVAFLMELPRGIWHLGFSCELDGAVRNMNSLKGLDFHGNKSGAGLMKLLLFLTEYCEYLYVLC